MSRHLNVAWRADPATVDTAALAKAPSPNRLPQTTPVNMAATKLIDPAIAIIVSAAVAEVGSSTGCPSRDLLDEAVPCELP
jgi:hypothetical protein